MCAAVRRPPSITSSGCPSGIAATSRRASRIGISSSCPPWISSSGTPVQDLRDADRLRVPWIGAQALRDGVESALRDERPQPAADAPPHRTRQARRDRIPDQRDDPWPGRQRDRRRRVRVAVGGRERAVAQDPERGERHDPAHRGPEQRHAGDPALARARPARRRHPRPRCSPNVVGPLSDSPWPRKSSPSTRAVRRRNGRVLHHVRRDRAGVAVEQQDRLVRVGAPSRPPGSASLVSQRAARRPPSRDRKRTTSPPSASSAGARAGLVGGPPRRVEDPLADAPAKSRPDERAGSTRWRARASASPSVTRGSRRRTVPIVRRPRPAPARRARSAARPAG